MSLKIIFLIGIVVITISTIGLGENLNHTSLFNYVGADDDISVPATNVVLTNMALTNSTSTIDSATITVKNTDSVSHTYAICVITKAGVSISDTVGTSPDCTNTSSISASNTGSAVINFSIPLNKNSVDFTDISIEVIT